MPDSRKDREIKFDNEEGRARDVISSLLLENRFGFDIKEYVDDINYVYFEDMININKKSIK